MELDTDVVQEWKEKLEAMKDIATFQFSSLCDDALSECGKNGDVSNYIKKDALLLASPVRRMGIVRRPLK